MNDPTRQPSRRWLDRLALLLLLVALLLTAPPLHAQYRYWQDTLLVPMRPLYGVDNTTFFISSWPATGTLTGNITELWSLLDSLGVNTMKLNVTSDSRLADTNHTAYDTTSIDTLHSTAGTHHLILEVSPIAEATRGREVEFYPFNEVQSPYFQWKFTDVTNTGDTLHNPNGLLERHYSDSTATAGQLIAANIDFDWMPDHVTRSLQNASKFINERRRPSSEEVTYNVVAKGHLFDQGQSPQSDSLFRIIAVYEVPQGRYFLNDTGAVQLADSDREFPIDTLYVKQSDLYPTGFPLNWNEYHQVSFPIQLDFCKDVAHTPGPLHPANRGDTSSHRIDLRVYWLGGEKVALRSIALRDSIGERVLGADTSYRFAIMQAARRLLRGPDLYNTSLLRSSIISFNGNDEPGQFEFAAYNRVDRMLRDLLWLELSSQKHNR